MNAERLLTHYERIADAPDAIARLRRFILDLAVRGKLVPQGPKVKPAQVIPSNEGKAQRALLTAGKIHAREEQPHALPETWHWVRIGDQLELLNGMAFKPSDWTPSGIRIVRIQNLNRLDAPFNFCAPDFARERSIIADGSFLISWSGTPGTSFGAFIWDRGPAVLNQHIFRCDFKTNAFLPEYLRIAINGRLDEMIKKAHGGVGLQHITKGKLEAMLIALPPLAEQHRIVAKVDELMALCDRLEAARAEREATRDRLTAASLARLNTPDPDPATFATHARFALDHLPALTARPDQIKHLRQTILNLAVRGKLVPQNPGEESGLDLLNRAAREIAEYSRSHRVSVPNTLPITSDKFPFSVPAGWVWSRLCALFRVITDGDHQAPPRADDGVAFLTIGNITKGSLDFTDCRLVSSKYFASLNKYRTPERGDILYTVVGATYGRPVLVDTDRGFCVQRHIAIMKPVKSMEVRFLLYLLASPFVFQQASQSTTGAAQPTIPLRPLRNFLVPVPPLAEQRRIVARVDELMALSDSMEQSLTQSEVKRRRLLEALLAEALVSPSAPTLKLAS